MRKVRILRFLTFLTAKNASFFAGGYGSLPPKIVSCSYLFLVIR